MTVDGTAVSGKSYEQVVKMIRGEAGTVVKLGVKGDGGNWEAFHHACGQRQTSERSGGVAPRSC